MSDLADKQAAVLGIYLEGSQVEMASLLSLNLLNHVWKLASGCESQHTHSNNFLGDKLVRSGNDQTPLIRVG